MRDSSRPSSQPSGSPPKPGPGFEMLRCLLLAATGLWLLHPFATSRLVGTGDALWYHNMLADFVTQWRSGQFPVFAGQTEYAFNGAVYPLRVAPLYQHLGGLLDLATGRQLGFFTLQHLLVIGCGLGGLFSCYLCLRHLAPGRPWSAASLSILYLSCPGVLGTIYTQDLYMTWMTVPFVPVAVCAAVRSCTKGSRRSFLVLAVALAAVWWGHSPVAMWLTLILGALSVTQLVLSRADAGVWKRAAGAGALFVFLAQYPFVSIAALQMPGTASAVTAGLTQQERITNVIHEVFPAVLLPVSGHARSLGDLQLGYGLWLVLLSALAVAVLTRHRILWALLAACAGLLLLLLPVPGLNEWLWQHLPEQIKRITFYWPMHRFYLLLAALLVVGGQLALAAGTNWRRGTVRVTGALLLAAVGWSLWESRQFIRAGYERTATSEHTVRVTRPENRLLMAHSYGLFPALPAYFSHGVMDAQSETRLLDPVTLAAGSVSPVPAESDWQPLRGTVDANPGILNLSPLLRLEAGRRYELRLQFPPKDYAGILQLSGRTFFREYILPASGEPLAFGTGPGQARRLVLWTTAADGDDVRLRFIPTGRAPAEFADFARYALRPVEQKDNPVQVESLLPYRASIRTAGAAWLETPRMFTPGYTARIDGQPVEVKRSPRGLVMVAVGPSTRQIELRFTGSLGLRFSYYLALTAWMGVLIAAGWGLLRRVSA